MKNRKKLTKFKKIALPLSVGILLAVVPFIYLQTKKAPDAKASWFDENWLYRQEVTIPNSGSETTNEVVSIPIDTKALIGAGKMQPSCSDVRFTSATGQPLKHNYKENPIKVTNVTSTKSEGSVSSISFTHTVEAGVNTALVVVYHGMKTSAAGNTFDITNATFNGDAMTEQVEIDSSGPVERDYATSIWTMVNPDVGTYTVAITLGEFVDSHVAAAYTVTGVDQTIVTGSTYSNSGTTDQLDLSGTNQYYNSLVVGGALRRNATPMDWERTYVSEGMQAYWEENAQSNIEISAAGGYAMVGAPAAGSPIVVSTPNALTERMNGAAVELVPNSPSDAYGCNTTHATEDTNFDVLVPKVRAGGEKVYMYYGNPRAASTITTIKDGTTDIDYKTTTEFESTTTSSTYSFSHNVTAGDNQALVVMLHASNQQSPDSPSYYYVDNVTFNGDPMFMQNRVETYITGENLSTEIWVLPNPDVTNGTVSITYSASIDRIMVAAMTFENVQRNLFPNAKTTNSTTSGSNLTLTLTTPSSDNYIVGGGVIEYATGSASTLSGLDAGEAETYTDETGTNDTIDIQGVGGYEFGTTPASESLVISPTSGSTHHINGAAIALEPVYFKYFTPTSSITTTEEKTTGPSGFWKFDEGASNTCTGGTADACDTTNNANDAIVSDPAMWQDAKYCITDSCLYFDGSSNVASVFQHATPVASWQFEEQTGLKASDSTGNDNSLTLNNISWTTSGKWNGAWDGTGSHWLTRADDSDFDFSTTDSFTISGWFKRSATSTQEYILAKEETTGADGGYRVSMESDGDIMCGVDTDNSGFPLDSVTSTAATYDDGTWHHFACAKNSTTNMILYIDGTSVATDSSLTGSGTYANDDALVIGDHTGVDDGNEFAGDLDDIRIFNSALSTSQLTALYNTGLAQSNMINVDQNLSGAVTFETWFKANSDGEGTGGEIFYKGTDIYARVTNEGSDNLADLEIEYRPATTATFSIADVVVLNKWHHLAIGFTNDADDDFTVYLDGEEIGTGSGPSPGLFELDTFDLLLGGSSSNNFHGFVDEFKIYAYERTSAEIKTDFLKNSSKSGSSSSTGYKDQDFLNQNLVGYWTMNDSSGNATDSSGNSLTLTNVGTATYSAGKFSNAVVTSASNKYLYTADNSDLSITGSLTLSAWVNPDAVSGTQTIAGKWDGANETYLLSLNGSAVRFSVNDAANYVETSSGAVSASVFQLISAVYDSNAQTVKIYVNGILQNTTTTGTIPSALDDDGGRFSVAAEDSTGGLSNYYNGDIDDLRLYSRALTANEVASLYNWTPSTTSYSSKPLLTARWKLDEGIGTTAHDSTSNANNLALYSASWLPEAKISGGWDGTGSVWMSRADDADFDFTATDSFTITGWFKRGNAGQEYILAKEEATGVDGGYRVSLEANGTVSCGVDTDNTSFPLDAVTSTASYENSTWHHFACVKNGSEQMLLYIDGSVVATDTSLTSAGTYANDDTLYIGDYNGSDNGNEFSGDLDDIHIYRSALSPEQVRTDMNAMSSTSVGITGNTEQSQLGSGTPSSTNIKGYWKFDENTSITLNDMSGNSDKLIASATTWVSGKFGSALGFDGSTSNASRADDADFDFAAADNFAISVWVKHNGAISSAADYIVAKAGSASGGGYKIYMDDTGDLCFAIDDDITWGPVDTACTSGVDFDDSKWHHILAQKTGTTGIYLYVNGLIVASDTSLSETGTLANDGALYIGADGTNNEWDGAIDEVKIFNTNLASDQIAYLYNRGKPFAWWKFDECTDTTIHDSGPFGMHGTLELGVTNIVTAGSCNVNESSSWYNARDGVFNSALDFGGDDDWIIIPEASSYYSNLTDVLDFDASADFSITGWFYRTSFTSDDVIIAKRTGLTDTADGYVVYIEDNASTDHLIFEASENGGSDEYSLTSTTNFSSTGWNHFAVVWDDDSAANTKMYINGKDDGATPTGDISLMGSLANSDEARIGSLSGSGSLFLGMLDDIRIYRYPLTAAQVKLIYTNGSAEF